jgi:flagellar biosynthesis/type III secretory pathway M-ring protein FliF/YscJ
VIDNGLVTSTARLEDGFLHHSLVTNKGAKIPASVQVADTTHTQGSSVSVTNTSDKQKEIIKEVNVLTTTQSFFITVGKVASGLVLLAILIFFGRFYLKKRGLLK